MQDIRVTSLGSFNVCAYKYANEEYIADWNNTYKGDILNMYATGRDDLAKIMLDHMQKYGTDKNKDIKLRLSIERAGENCMQYLKDLTKRLEGFKKKYPLDQHALLGLGAEMNMVLPFNKNINLIGKPDLFFFDREYENELTVMQDESRGISRPDGIWVIEDLKMSTHKWFGTDATREESMQWLCYPLMIMTRMGTDECVFNFQVFDSGNGTRKCFSRHVTKKMAIARVALVIDKYMEYEALGIAEPKQGRFCRGMCGLKDTTCPLFRKATVTAL